MGLSVPRRISPIRDPTNSGGVQFTPNAATIGSASHALAASWIRPPSLRCCSSRHEKLTQAHYDALRNRYVALLDAADAARGAKFLVFATDRAVAENWR